MNAVQLGLFAEINWKPAEQSIVYLLPANVSPSRRDQLKAKGNAVTTLDPLPYHALVRPNGYIEMWIPHADGTYDPLIAVCPICGEGGVMDTTKVVYQGKEVIHEECYTRMEAYQDKVDRRYERLLNAARKHEQESNRLHEYTDKVYGALNGTPILVGHHSEKRHRRLLDKLWNMDGKAYEHYKTAERLRQRAEASGKNRAISSDDPAAVLKLKEKLQKLECNQAEYKRLNAIVRKLTRDKVYLPSVLAPQLAAEANVSGATALNLLTPDFAGRVGIPDYELRNNGAEIRRLKQRIEDLQKQVKHAQDTPETERAYGDIRVIENATENRLQIFFPVKPSKDVIKALKASGFHWSPSNMVWQRMLSNGARWAAECVLKAASVSIPD